MQASRFEDPGRGRMDDPLATSIASRVEEIVASAERAAANMQREVESAALTQAADIRAAAEADAARIRRDAEALVGRWLAESRERIDAFTDRRIAQIDELTEMLVTQADALQRRFEAAESVRAQVYDLISALGHAAERLAREASGEAQVPRLGGDMRASAAAPAAPPPPPWRDRRPGVGGQPVGWPERTDRGA